MRILIVKTFSTFSVLYIEFDNFETRILDSRQF